MPSVAVNGSGKALITWSGNGPGDDQGIFAQRYSTLSVPTLSISGAQVTEGDTGTSTEATFTVTLSESPAGPVTVSYTTSNGTATAGEDYQAAAGTLTFLPDGPLTQPIPVTVIGEIFTVPLVIVFVSA